MRKRDATAVVLGAGIAGLASARVLSNHFETVYLVDKDALGDASNSRKSVPQGAHIHLLWSGGMNILKHWFPDLGKELEQTGSTKFDTSAQMRWYHQGVWKLRHRSELEVYAQSRPFLERALLDRVEALPGITVLPRHQLKSLMLNDQQDTLEGIELESLDSSELLSIETGLVIDATGRSAATLQQLRSKGFQMPEEETIQVDIGYATCVFEQPESDATDWSALVVYPEAPISHRLGVIFPIENKRWIVTLVGLRGHYLKEPDFQSYLDFAASLDKPEVYEAITKAKPVSPVQLIRYPNQNRRHFRELSDYPAGLIPVGDTITSLNPLYGQGMTVAIKQAQLLDECLESQPEKILGKKLQQQYLNAIEPIVDDAWLLGSMSDFLYPETSGKRPPFYGVVKWYLTRLLVLSSEDEVIQQSFMRVIHLQARVRSLLRPSVLLRVLLGRKAPGLST